MRYSDTHCLLTGISPHRPTHFLDICSRSIIQPLHGIIIRFAKKLLLQFQNLPCFFVFVQPDRTKGNGILHLSCPFRFAFPIPPFPLLRPIPRQLILILCNRNTLPQLIISCGICAHIQMLLQTMRRTRLLRRLRPILAPPPLSPLRPLRHRPVYVGDVIEGLATPTRGSSGDHGLASLLAMLDHVSEVVIFVESVPFFVVDEVFDVVGEEEGVVVYFAEPFGLV
mmetsp:Transcript_27071/g.58227  ORF Transcript_27071/g.58227 Transcript_27071/m.58227 type:complete len:225 (+) Transcript_27071:123-797(+)